MRPANYILSIVLMFTPALGWTDNSVLTDAATAAMHSAVVHTGAQATQPVATTTATTTSSTSTTSTNSSTQASPATRGETAAQTSINQAADTGRRSQNAGMMMNIIAAAGLFAACAASTPPRMELCAMGALAAAQAANQGAAANQSDLAFDASEFQPGDYTYNPGGDGSTVDPASVDGSGTAVFSNPHIKEGMGMLTEAGYKVSQEGITLPDGTFVPASSFSSPEAMAAAGLDPSAAGDVLAAVNSELQKLSEASVASMGVDGGPGGGGASSGAGSVDFGDLDSFALPQLKNPFDKKVDEKKLLAGKSLMVNGEPIGVKGDNIFDMVHRAYQKKRGKNIFLETAKNPARLPASLTSGDKL